MYFGILEEISFSSIHFGVIYDISSRPGTSKRKHHACEKKVGRLDAAKTDLNPTPFSPICFISPVFVVTAKLQIAETSQDRRPRSLFENRI